MLKTNQSVTVYWQVLILRFIVSHSDASNEVAKPILGLAREQIAMNESECLDSYRNFTATVDALYCNATFDGMLCWSPTPAGTSANQSCPNQKGLDATQLAIRTCLSDGRWQSSNFTKDRSKGYTNYKNCVPPHGQDLFKMCQEIEGCIEIIETTRVIEFVGLFLSVFTLILSLFIFYRYRVLKNNRTSIHKNLFLATTIQMSIRLCMYIDHSFGVMVIKETEYLCEACIVLLEYTKTAMFMWMFIEGLYLHNVITVAVFQEHFYIKLYFYLGWGVPLLIVFIWTFVMIFAVVNTGCWFLYNFMPHYWILEGPRYTVIILNMIFLLNIIRVLVVKLRRSKTSEIEQVRKAVRAAIFLLPLMGIANILFIVDYKVFKKAWKFALWCYVTYFITTFQGFFVAILYCFLNEEVRTAISHSFATYMSLRKHKNFPNRNSVIDTNLAALGYSDQ